MCKPTSAEELRSSESDVLSDIVVASVGTASPRAVAAVAAGLGLPVEAAVATVYRAPAVLAGNVAAPLAARIADVLGQLGLVVEVTPAGIRRAATPLLDLAAEIADPLLVDEAAAVLARFIGIAPAAALELLLNPPGLILGAVSAATVQALERQLPAGALVLTTCDAGAARYALFAPGASKAEAAAIVRLVPDLAEAPAEGLVAWGLSRAAADQLWRQLAGSDGVRLVPEDFLRFDIEVASVAAGAEAELARLADIPIEHVGRLRGLLPLVVEERVAFAALAERLAAYSESGIAVRARLATFAHARLQVRSASPAALALAGLDRRAPLPLTLPQMAASRARVLRCRLEAAGADVVQLEEAA